jgi:predicted small lipoprotein YifL
MKTTITTLTTAILTIFALTACGGGGGDTTPAATTTTDTTEATTPETTVPTLKTVSSCEDTNGDLGEEKADVVATDATIHKLTDPTTIRIWHLESGDRKCCVVSGDAEII